MKVILKENVEHLGQIGDLVKVAPGYARNFLLPRGFAMTATEGNKKSLEHTKRQLEYKKNKVLELARSLAAKLESLVITTAHKAGEEGKLFGSVTNMEVAELLKAQGVEIDRKMIEMAAIKQVGEHTATVKIHPEVVATLKVNVVAA
jgi:large subunit ribosomal protein L9